jgi:metal-responsive CopG/Arc/MetJ family transcriptional regulator
MATVKTAISIDKPLFEQADAVARELNIPRSRVFVIALQEYLRRRQHRRLLDQINAVYGDGLDDEERDLLRHLAPHQRQIMESAE